MINLNKDSIKKIKDIDVKADAIIKSAEKSKNLSRIRLSLVVSLDIKVIG